MKRIAVIAGTCHQFDRWVERVIQQHPDAVVKQQGNTYRSVTFDDAEHVCVSTPESAMGLTLDGVLRVGSYWQHPWWREIELEVKHRMMMSGR